MATKITPRKIKQLISKLPDFKNCQVSYVEAGGVSTEVYRLTDDNQNYYLRLANENENISSEALAHQLIRNNGVRAPKVLYFEDFNQEIARSFMVTEEIPGIPANQTSNPPHEIFIEAGKQLALINSISVKGFGWLDRKKPNVREITAIYSSYEEFALNFDQIEHILKNLVDNQAFSHHLSKRYLKYVHHHQQLLKIDQACLSHGDFAADHIYVNENKYSGIIDFGDIRATSIYHDLARFYTCSPEYFPPLIKGYQTITDLGENYMEKIKLVAMLFVIGKLWWTVETHPEKLDKRHSDFKMIYSLLKHH